MNKKIRYLSAVISVLALFTACDILGSAPEQRSWPDEKAAVSVRIAAEGAQARTLKPDVVLQDAAWELWGGQDDTQSLLAEFSGTEGATVNIDPGTWNFTLNGYKDSALILSGSLEGQTISLTETNTLAFTVAPIMEGDGTVRIVIELPSGSGITSAQVLWGSAEPAALTPSSDSIVFEGTYSAGTYYFSVRLYKDAALYGVVSEAVHVWAHLQSEKTYTLTLENLNLTYIISYHVVDAEVEFGYYQRTDPKLTLPLPFRQGYVFRGWYESADFSGDALTEIPAGSTGNRDVYAKWITAEQTTSSTLAESLAWISANAVDGGAYAITLNADETLDPTMLHYGDKIVDIVLNGGSAERTVTLGSSGSLFIVNNGVTLALGPNVTLQGRSNTAALLRVNAGGTLTMDAGAKINGNEHSSGDGGGVYVYYGTFTMNAGTISGNNSSGVYVDSSGTFTKESGGTIYGVNADSALRNNGYAAYVSSGPKIRNTTAGIGVTLNSGVSGLAGGWETALPSDYSFAQSLTWLSANAEEGGAYTITLSANETIAPQTLSYSGKNITITLKGDSTERAISLNVPGSLFTVESGVTLMLGNRVTLQGRSGNTASLVQVNNGATLMMNSGSKISGNQNTSSSGGGVSVSSGGTFTMSGGEISGNTASSGSGVYVSGGGAFLMSGGTLSGNTAAYNGGGASIYGTFTMSGGAISNNTASSSGGGGVYADSSGVFTKLVGGVIYGSNADAGLKNTAAAGDDYGHAVYVSSSKKRNGTALSDVTLDSSLSGAAGGWE